MDTTNIETIVQLWLNALKAVEIREADSINEVAALQADFNVNGIWEAERVAFFDNRIINADAPSYLNRGWRTT